MKKVVKIVTFYDDGTFEESRPYVGAPMPTPYPYYPPVPTYGPVTWPKDPYVYPWKQPEITCKVDAGPAHATCQGELK